MKDALGDRMKRQYEDRTRVLLPRRTYTIIRVDGKAFHTFTHHCDKPYDVKLVAAMNEAALALCAGAQGARLAYVQSDEISVLLTDFDKPKTEAWFDGNLQKIVSVSASIATAAFNAWNSDWDVTSKAHFDARAFTIPDPVEVENYFIWRQQDAVRNSIQSTAQSLFSHQRLQGLNSNQLQELMFAETGLNWNDLPTEQKRGRVVRRDLAGTWEVDVNPATFTQDRRYLQLEMPRCE